MNSVPLLRLGACAAIGGAAAQLIATVLEPDWGGEAGTAVRVVAGSGIWTADRLLDLIGVVLTLAALTVVGHLLADNARDSARLATPFLILMTCLGTGAILTGAVMKDLAQRWTGADGVAQQSYLAAFDAVSRLTEDLFFGAFVALAVYLAALAPAIVRSEVFPHWTGWACMASAVLIFGGNLLSILFDPAFLAVLAGFALYLIVVAAFGVSMWRRAASTRRPAVQGPHPVAVRS